MILNLNVVKRANVKQRSQFYNLSIKIFHWVHLKFLKKTLSFNPAEYWEGSMEIFLVWVNGSVKREFVNKGIFLYKTLGVWR